MTRGNPDIAAEGKGYAAGLRADSQAKIAAAKARIKERVLSADHHGAKLTIASVLEEAGLNRLYLEGKDRRADKQDLKDWLASAARRFKPSATQATPSQKLEDRFEVLKTDFIRLQNAYVAAHLQHNDRAVELAEAKEEIRELKAVNAELRRTVQATLAGS